MDLGNERRCNITGLSLAFQHPEQAIFGVCSIREGALFKRAVYLVNLEGQVACRLARCYREIFGSK